MKGLISLPSPAPSERLGCEKERTARKKKVEVTGDSRGGELLELIIKLRLGIIHQIT